MNRAATNRPSWKTFSPLALFCFSGLNIFFSVCFIARTLGLPSIVLMSPYLDWSAWVVSGNAFAWIILATAKSEAPWTTYLGILVLAGSVVEVLSSLLPGQRWLISVSWIGGASMTCALVALTIMCLRDSRRMFSISSTTAVRLLLMFLGAVVIPLQVWSIAAMSPFPASPRDYPQVDVYGNFERLWQMLLPVTTILFVLLTTEWLWSPIAAKIGTTVKRPKTASHNETLQAKRGSGLYSGWRLLALASLLIAILVSGYRWFRGYPLGDDAKYYSLILQRMNVAGAYEAFSTERPFLFLGLYAVEKALGLEALLLLRLLPLALSIILVTATYYFARFVTGSESVAALAAVFAAVSPHVTVAAEYFIAANWLGIPLMMLFLYGVLKSVEKRSLSWFLFTIALSSLTLAVHYFTWIFMIFVVVAYMLLSLLENRSSFRRGVRLFAAVILCCIAPIVPALLVAYVIGGGLLTSLQLVEHMIGLFLTQATPVNFINFLMNRERVESYFSREHYAIPLLFLFALIGSFELRALKTDRGRLARSWLIASCLGLLTVYYNEWWRFLYMIPFEILGAFGVTFALRYSDLHEKAETSTTAGHGSLRTMIQLALFLAFGILLASSTLPSTILLLCPAIAALTELVQPFKEERIGADFLIVTFLVLEQIVRALCVLA